MLPIISVNIVYLISYNGKHEQLTNFEYMLNAMVVIWIKKVKIIQQASHHLTHLYNTKITYTFSSPQGPVLLPFYFIPAFLRFEAIAFRLSLRSQVTPADAGSRNAPRLAPLAMVTVAVVVFVAL